MGAGYTAPTYKCVARVLWCSLSGICYIFGISYIFVVGISLGGFFGDIRPEINNIFLVGLSPGPGRATQMYMPIHGRSKFVVNISLG